MFSELHTSSAFSFLRASSTPEHLVDRATDLGYEAIGLADRDNLAGAPRFFQAARKAGLRSIVGAEISLPDDRVATLLVENAQGYRHLCRLITTRAKDLRDTKAPAPTSVGFQDPELLAGLVAVSSDPETAHLLAGLFGRDRTFVEVRRHLTRESHADSLALLDFADAEGLHAIASNGALHAKPQGRRILDVFTCIRNHTTLSKAGRLLSQNTERFLKQPATMETLFSDRRDVLRNTEALADQLRFSLVDLGYEFPSYPLPAGETMDSFLRAMTEMGALARYGFNNAKARAQIDHELRVIAKLGLAGYFLIVWDIVNFCRNEGILAQGRGSAANSAVCYSLGITAVDPVGMELLFERFLTEERGEWPDIDIDLPSGDRREKVIQYVYRKYGPHGAAMTANVITYRDKSAAREIGKVLELSEEVQERISEQMQRFEWRDEIHDSFDERMKRAGADQADNTLKVFARLFHDMQDLPRHLGQHSGGMIVAQGRLDEVVPLQPAAMPGRTIVQWDKEDCADLKIIKIDLLGLGMMSALHDCITMLGETGVDVDIAHLPPDDPATYRQMRAADTVGVFQIESRAQMATLPRMKPERFYDLVVEVAIIRPGPIVGKMVHPYLDRRNKRKPVEYAHPSLEPILRRTLGVPLFQEQLLRMAMTVADFTGGEAEELRRAMGFKRSKKRMLEIQAKLRAGMDSKGIPPATQEEVVKQIASFALYGFPESHSASFALIAYASAYLRCHHHAAFVCALLNNQPMGFYHPDTLVKDAQRHRVKFLPIDVTASDEVCSLQPSFEARDYPDTQYRVRMGLNYVAGLRAPVARSIIEERRKGGFRSLEDFTRRTRIHGDELERLASIGALAAFGKTRREALWQVAKLGRSAGPLFEGVNEAPAATEQSSPLKPMTSLDRLRADVEGTSLTIGAHYMARFRESLSRKGILSARDLATRRDGDFVRVAGAVICRQRPGTAKGFLFLTLEDETGLANIIVRPDQFNRYRELLSHVVLLQIDGVLQAKEGVMVRGTVFSPIKDVQEEHGSLVEGLPEIPARSFR